MSKNHFRVLTNEDLNKEEVKEEKEKIVEPVKPKPKLKIIDIDSKTRPFAVMINNINVARPLQSGLQDAYIVYEIIVEGGITRYMAVFQDQQTEEQVKQATQMAKQFAQFLK